MIEEKFTQIQELEREIKTLDRGVFSLEKHKDYKAVFTEFFDGLLTNGIKIDVHSEGRNISFLLYDKELNRDKEIFSLYKNWDFGDREISNYQLSYYTSFCNTAFEYERLVILGKVAEFMMNEENSKDLLYLHNTVSNIYKDEIAALKSQIHDKGRLITKLKEEIDVLKKEEKIKSLKSTGITYIQGKRFDIRPNQYVKNIISIRLVNYTTPTKKTATFEFKDGGGYVFVLEKVKVENIISQI